MVALIEEEDWVNKYPKLVDFLLDQVVEYVTPYGMIYFQAMTESWIQYKEEGIGCQLLYISANLHPQTPKDIFGKMEEWSEYLSPYHTKNVKEPESYKS